VDLVVLSEVRWSYFRTRKQFLLSRFPKPWRILFAQPPGGGAEDPWEPRQEGNVTFFTVPFLKPGTKNALYNTVANTAPGRALIERAAEAHLRKMLAKLGAEREPVVLVSNIYAVRALSRLPRKLVAYDFNDSPFQFAGSPAWANGYWNRTRALVDLFFVVSEHYRRELARETDRRLVLLGNGVEWDRFRAPHPVPPDLASLPRPLIGYVGLMSHFLCFDTLEALRVNRRGGTLVLIGPNSPATDGAVRNLAAREGVCVLGTRPYDEVPALMQSLDVGLIPFRAEHPHVTGINPNKIYQYLAAGTPVVSTPVLDLAEQRPLVSYASNPAEMVAAVNAVLDAPPDRNGAALLAKPHDWGHLAQTMVAEIENTLARRPSGNPARPSEVSRS
jgi:glycosyltransferase involved in cell wall biosynthesis